MMAPTQTAANLEPLSVVLTTTRNDFREANLRCSKNPPDWNESRFAKNVEASARTIELALIDLVPSWHWMTTSRHLSRNSAKFGGCPVDLKKGARLTRVHGFKS